MFMARYVVHVRSPKAPADAFAYMADLTNFAEWDPVGARYSVVAGQAACWYSWMSPSQRVDFTTRRWFGSARG